MAAWKTLTIFVTSTFRDMHAERDHLRRIVFPELEERLKEHQYHLEAIDLRWGIDTPTQEAIKESIILKVCLSEITRSKPFVIGLLGDRYGWIPPEDQITLAARDAGYKKAVSGMSITELEIDFAVLSRPESHNRCLFYFRDKLPYETMPPSIAARFCEHHATKATLQIESLNALKRRIRDTVPERVHRYSARWDPTSHTVTGLEDWGQSLTEDLWNSVEREIEYLPRSDYSSEAAERWVLEQFIEDRSKNFVGRASILEDLISLATNLSSEQQKWGVCVTGPAGAGKSAIFAELSRRLPTQNLLVLARAIGTSPLSTQMHSIVEIWTTELAAALGQSVPPIDDSNYDALLETFFELLARASTEMRVVVLLDGLDQLEKRTLALDPSPLSRDWPDNSCVVAFSIPCSASERFVRRPDVREIPIPQLRREEAARVAEAICREYHRKLSTEVLEEILGKCTSDGTMAAGNPLWLNLAVQELNLVGYDEFINTEKELTSEPEKAIDNLLISVVREMPTRTQTLYCWILRRAEQLHGIKWVQALTRLLSASRFGLRDSDLQELVPGLSGEPWTDLQFSSVRRSLGNNLVQRGNESLWDFTHSQLRNAVIRRDRINIAIIQDVHKHLADHLASLPAEDTLRNTELFFHLTGARDGLRVGKYLAALEEPSEELFAAAEIISNELLEDKRLGARNTSGTLESFDWILSILSQPELTTEERACVSAHYQGEVFRGLHHVTDAPARRRLVTNVQKTLINALDEEPQNYFLNHDLVVAHLKEAETWLDEDRPKEAQEAYVRAARLISDQGRMDGGLLAMTYVGIGDVLLRQGKYAAALDAYFSARDISQDGLKHNPEDDYTQHRLSLSYERVADALVGNGDLEQALCEYGEARSVLESLLGHRLDVDGSWNESLCRYHLKTGNAQHLIGDTARALASFKKAEAIIRRLVDGNPSRESWQRFHWMVHIRIGDLLLEQKRQESSLDAYNAALYIARRLARHGSLTESFQVDLVLSLSRFVRFYQESGNRTDAEQYWGSCRKQLLSIPETKQNSVLAALPRSAELPDEKLVQLDIDFSSWNTFWGQARIEPLYASAERYWAEILGSSSLSVEQIGKRVEADGLLEKGVKSLETGRFQEAEDYLHQGLEIAREADDPVALSTALAEIGHLSIERGEVLQSIPIYHEALSIAKKAERDAGTRRIAEGAKRLIGTISSHLGIAHNSMGDYDKAIEYHKRSIEIATERRDNEAAAAFHSQLGNVYQYQCRHEKAIQTYKKSLELARSLGDEAQLAMIYGNLGNAYEGQGDSELAVQMLERGLEIKLRMGNEKDTAANYGNLGISYYQLGMFDKSIKMHLKAIDIDSKYNNDAGVANRRGNLAMAYHALGEVGKASENYLASIEFFERSRDRRSAAIFHFNMGRLCKDRNDIGGARRYFERAAFLFEGIGQGEWFQRTSFELQRLGAMSSSREPSRRRGARRGIEVASEVLSRIWRLLWRRVKPELD